MLLPLLWLGEGLLVELHIWPHYWLLGIRGRSHALFGPLLEIAGLLGFLWHVDWTNRPFGPSMGLPPAFVLHCCELYNEVGQCLGLNCSPRAVLYVELTQLITHNTNRLAAFGLFIVFRRGLFIWTTIVCA